jgi:hypothetical protein
LATFEPVRTRLKLFTASWMLNRTRCSVLPVPRTCNRASVPFSEVRVRTEVRDRTAEALYTLWTWSEQSPTVVQGSKYLKSIGIVMRLPLKLTRWALLCSVPWLQHTNQICMVAIQLRIEHTKSAAAELIEIDDCICNQLERLATTEGFNQQDREDQSRQDLPITLGIFCGCYVDGREQQPTTKPPPLKYKSSKIPIPALRCHGYRRVQPHRATTTPHQHQMWPSAATE